MKPLAGEARNRALQQLAMLCFLRSKGQFSEDQIAGKLGFVDEGGSPLREAMYERLESWGIPGWVVRPGGAGKQAETWVEGGRNKKERKARGTGAVEELPAAGRAVGLFREDLERLARYVDELPSLREQLQARRFVWSSWVGEDWDYYNKSDFSEEGWRTLCGRLGEDPSEEAVRVPIDPVTPGGAGPTPWEGLVPLIAVHAIMHETVDDLLEALHPDPSSVEETGVLEAIYKDKGYVDTLKTYAARLARTVRGGKVKEGQLPPEFSYVDHWVALFLITPRAERGHSDEQIHAWMQRKHPSLAEPYTVEDIARLRNLRLPPPDRTPPEELL